MPKGVKPVFAPHESTHGSVNRYAPIEGLRAVLAWWVVVSHCLRMSGLRPHEIPDVFGWAIIGILPVYGFVVISGFVITHLILLKREPYGVFLFRRYFRLMPVMALAIVAAWFVDAFDIARWWPHKDTGFRLLMQVTLMHGVMPEDLYTRAAQMFSGPAWSISLEWQYYLIAPLTVFALMRGGFWLFFPAIVLVVGFVSGVGFSHQSMQIFSYNLEYSKPSILFAAYHLFILGALIYLGQKSLSERGIELPRNAFWLACLSLVVLSFFFYGTDNLYRWMVAPLAGLVAIVVLWPGSILARALEARWLAYCGTISYSTYLLHIFVVLLVSEALDGRLDDGWLKFVAVFGLAAPLIFLVSVISYHGLEKPVNQWAGRVAAKWRNKASGGPAHSALRASPPGKGK